MGWIPPTNPLLTFAVPDIHNIVLLIRKYRPQGYFHIHRKTKKPSIRFQIVVKLFTYQIMRGIIVKKWEAIIDNDKPVY